jgi:hypothetical protein
MKARITYDKFTGYYEAEYKLFSLFWITAFPDPDNKWIWRGIRSNSIHNIYEWFDKMKISREEIQNEIPS